MTRSTVVLSLITLLALGGCNTSSGSKTSEANDATSSAPIEQLAKTPDANTAAPSTTENPSETAPPANVSQPVDVPSGGNSVVEDSAGSASATGSTSVTDSTAKAPVATSNTAKPDQTVNSNTDEAEPDQTVNGNNDEAEPSTGVTVQSAQTRMSDPVIVPGEKVGIVTRNTTYADLENTFGSDRLTTQAIHLGEGVMAPSTQVVLDDGYSFKVVWTDESHSQPLDVRDFGTGWQIQGIHNGMSFEELKAALGEFELWGLGWDYGGTLILENTPLAAYEGNLFIRVQPSTKVVETQPEKFLAVAREAVFSSSDPNFADLELSVVSVEVRLD